MEGASSVVSTTAARFRNLNAAREAYAAEGDETLRRELSREAHSLLSDGPPAGKANPTWSPWLEMGEAGHNEERAYHGATLLLRGALDGLVLSLAALSLGDAAGFPTRSTVTLTAALLGCWSVYSAIREALESVTYGKYYSRERSREAWELENFPEGEVEEMVQLYCKRGLPEHAARTVITTMATSPDFFVDIMMLEELQMSPPSAVSALSAALRYGLALLVCGGALPLVGALLDRTSATDAASSSSFTPSYAVVVCLAVAALGYLGWLRAGITHQGRKSLALQTAAMALPVVLLARFAGAMLGEHMQLP